MRAALLGYGYWGKIIEKYIQSSPFFELSVIFSRNIDHPKGTNVFDDLFDLDIEAVFIALPPDLLSRYTKICLEKGMHVFCEKPLSKDPKGFEELEKLASNLGLCLFVNYILLYSPGVGMIKSMLEKMGQLQSAAFYFEQKGKQFNGFNAFDIIGCHWLSVYFYLKQTTELPLQDFLVVDLNPHQKKQHMSVRFSSNKTKTKILANLISDKKRRSFKLNFEDSYIHFDVLSNPTIELFTIDRSNYTSEKTYEFQTDESQNLIYSIDAFSAAIINKNNLLNTRISRQVTRTLNLIESFE